MTLRRAHDATFTEGPLLVGLDGEGNFIVSTDIDHMGPVLVDTVLSLHRVGDRILIDPPTTISELTVTWPRRWCWPFTHVYEEEYRFSRCRMCGRVRP